MAHVMQLKDGSVWTLTKEKDFYDLVRQYLGTEALGYLRRLIEDACLLTAAGDVDRIEELEAEVERLKRDYRELEERYEEVNYYGGH